MITLKSKPQTDKELAHIELYHNGSYMGYIIKSNPTEPKGWFFVNESQNKALTETKLGYNSSMFEKTKTKLIDRINSLLVTTK